jgi:hypothetical protein
VRPLGRSSQDTGLLLKGGYVSLDTQGLWYNSTTPNNIYASYLGAEAKVYLLLFLGLKADYENFLETNAGGSLSGKWKMQRFKYGAFVEVAFLNLAAYLQSVEIILTPTSTNTAIKETSTGYGLSASLHF